MATAKAIPMPTPKATATEKLKMPDAEKEAKVKASASKKVSKALTAVTALVKLAKKLTPEQQDKVLLALQDAAESVATEFENSRNGKAVKQASVFSL